MDKYKKTNTQHPSYTERQQKRLTTAPIKQRTRYSDMHKNNNNNSNGNNNNNFQLPYLKVKNTVINQRQSKKISNTSNGKRQQILRCQIENYEQAYKRPQTSKGSRKNYNYSQSQFHQDDGQDLFSTTFLQQKRDLFKKNLKDVNIPIYKS